MNFKNFTYRNIIPFFLFVFFSSCSSTEEEPQKSQFNAKLTYGTVTDVDGNVYKTIVIGTQTWMAENLRTSKFRDGSLITNVTDTAVWRTTKAGAWCDFNNDVSNGVKYGKLYNWYAVADVRKIAPEGWHVPTDAEWTKLQTFIANITDSLSKKSVSVNDSLVKMSYAKALSSQSYWIACPTLGAVGCNPLLNNLSGFSALPGGNRYLNGSFNLMGSDGFWWSSTATPVTAVVAKYRNLSYSFNGIFSNTDSKQNGYSVRCVKD